METLVVLLVDIVIFALVAYALFWICTRFFPNFQPALWVCGALLLLVLLFFVSGQLGGPLLLPLRK